MGLQISDNIFAKCLPALSTDIERCGGVTLCDVSPTTENELTSIYKDSSGRFRIIGALLEADFTGKACQNRQYGMYDFIMANKRELGTKKLAVSEINHGLWEVMPFIKMLRKHPINNEYWTVSSGSATPGTINGVAYDYTALVESQTSIPSDVRWFPDVMRVFINGKTTGGTATRTAWKIVSSAIVGTKIRLYLVTQNTGSFLDAAKLEAPVTGVLTRGTPNVNDFEKYCPQIPGLNTNQLTPFWLETTRWAMCEDELVQKYLTAIRDNNPYFKKFGDVESVELNRQITEDFQRRHANAFFFNKALPNQTLKDYDKLDKINVYSDDKEGNYLYLPFEGRCIGRRAAATGIYEQHAECGRVKDLQGQVLNIPELQVTLYNLIRTRKSNGISMSNDGNGPIIEMFTDSFYATQLAQGFLRYFKFKSEGLLRLNQELSAKKNAGPLGFFYQRFAMDYPNCEIRIVTHEFFDDIVDAMKKAGATLETAGRFLWIMEWSTNYQAIIESNSQTNKSGDIGELAKVDQNIMCVMKVPKKSQKLYSLSYANVSECPQSSIFLENMSSDVPEHEKKVGVYEDLYGNYPGNPD